MPARAPAPAGNRPLLRLNALSAALLLGLGGGQVLAQGVLARTMQGANPVSPSLRVAQSTAQSAIDALANIATHAGDNMELARIAITAIADIAVRTAAHVKDGGVIESGVLPDPVRTVPALPAPTAGADEADTDEADTDRRLAEPPVPPAVLPIAPMPVEQVLVEPTPVEQAAVAQASSEYTPVASLPAPVPEPVRNPSPVAKAPAQPVAAAAKSTAAPAAPTAPPASLTPKGSVRLISETPLVQGPPAAPPALQPVPAHAPLPGQPPALPVVPIRPLPVAMLEVENDTEDDKKEDGKKADGKDSRKEGISSKPVPPAAPSALPAPAGNNTTDSPATGKYTFDSAFLAFPVDLQLFAEGNPVLPGVHRVDVYLNDKWVGRFDVRFANLAPADRIAQPCFDADFLETLGLDPQHYLPDAQMRLQAGESICGSLAQITTGASSAFHASAQKLMLSAPQAVLKRTPRGYVNPKRRDAGMTAATLAWNYNAYSNKGGGGGHTQTSHYLGLRTSLNLGNWRVRLRSTLSKAPGGDPTWQRGSLYVERGVPSLKSRLVVGESATNGHVFDSVSLLGAQLFSDARMRPDAQGGFVPIIRGMAQSNAKVTVTQRGEQIYEMTVPPGPFVIDDIYPNGRGGDLLVTVTEADGSVRRFTETYANLPEMLRPGSMRYTATVGRYRNRLLEEEPVLGMLTGSYGFNNLVTGYGGAMLAAGYHSAVIGAGLNLPIGAVSADATWANTRAAKPDGDHLSSHGYAFRLGWAKLVPQLDTDVTLAMYRYATQGFYAPDQAFQLRDAWATGKALNSYNRFDQALRRRNQLALRFSHQPKGRWGAFSLGVSMQDYWNRDVRDLQYHFGWGRNFGSVSLGLTVNRSRNDPADTSRPRWENQVMLNLSMPLGAALRNPAHLNSSFTKSRNGHQVQASVSGALGERGQTGWSLFASGDKTGGAATNSNGGASASLTTSVARIGTSVSTATGGGRQMSVSGSGGLVAFKGGVVLSPELGDTVGVVQARHALGAVVQSGSPTTVNARGHAVVPHLQPYRENTITLNPKGLSKDVELLSSSQKVVPTDGAVVSLTFETRRGYAMLVSGKRPDGSALPFAAGVLNEHGRNVGYVAQGGHALLRTDAPRGRLTVRWGPENDQQCAFDYDVSDNGRAPVSGTPDSGDFKRVQVLCE